MGTPIHISTFGSHRLADEPTNYESLPPGLVSADNLKVANDYITTVLLSIRQEGAYGTVMMVDSLAVILIGADIKDLSMPDPPPGFGRIRFEDDRIVRGRGWWPEEKVKDTGGLRPDTLSVGLRKEVREAGSFGGFFHAASGAIYGTTAAHVFGTNATIGDEVSAPAPSEINARFQHILPYTRFCPPNDRIRVAPNMHAEAAGIITRYQFQEELVETPDRPLTRFIDANGEPKQGTFVGRKEGVLCNILDSTGEGIVAKTNARLREQLRPEFPIDPKVEGDAVPNIHVFSTDVSANDLAVFKSTRTDPLPTNEDAGGSKVNGICDAYPGEKATKWGRTTGETTGIVGGAAVIVWSGGRLTIELGIAHQTPGQKMALPGDSGSLLCSERVGGRMAIGLIHGMSTATGLALFTPSWRVKELLEEFLGETVSIMA